MLGKTATTAENFKDMVKIVWRVVKSIEGSPMHRLALFFLSVGAVVETVRGTQGTSGGGLAEGVWRSGWAKQLTVGGKGVGEGEGRIVTRVQQFFSTPYLHEFD